MQKTSKMPLTPRLVTVHVNKNKDMRIQGTGRWAEFGDAWQTAHDLMHHASADAGRVEEELKTFGVEKWLSGNNLEEIEESSMAGVLHESLASKSRLTPLHLQAPPAVTLPPDVFRWAESLVRREFSLAESYFEKSALILRGDNIANAARWVAIGHMNAKIRYPNPQKAAALFRHLQEWMKDAADQSNRSFSFLYDEKLLKIKPKSISLQKIWRFHQGITPSRRDKFV